MAVNKAVQFLLSWQIDQQAANNTMQQNKRVAKSVDDIRASVERANQRISEMEDLSTRAAAASAAVFIPLIASAQNYVNQVGAVNNVTRQWIAQTQRQQSAQAALGKKATEALLPYREALTDILEITSRLDPQIIEAGVGSAAVIGGVATIGLLASQIARLYNGIILLSASIRQLGVSGGLGGAVGIAGAATIGVFGGIEATRAIGRATNNERLQEADLQQLLEYIFDALRLIVAAFGAAAKFVETQFNSARKQFELMIFDLENGLTSIPKLLEQMIIGLQLAVADIVGGDIAGFIGIDRDALRRRASELDARPQIDEINEVDLYNTIVAADPSLSAPTIDRLVDDALAGNFDAIRATASPDAFEAIMASIDDTIAERQRIERDALERQQDIEARYTDFANVLLEYDFDRITGADSADNEQMAQPVFGITEMMLDDYAMFLEAQQALQDDFESQQLASRQAFNTKMSQLETDYQAKVADAKQAYIRDNRELDSDFLEQQAERQVDFNKQVADLRESAYAAERDAIKSFNLQRIRAEEDYQDRINDARANRDARALRDIFKDRRRTRQRSTEDFGIEKQQRQQNLAQSLNDLAETFSEQRTATIAEYQERKNDLRAAFENENRERERAYREALRTTRQNYRQQQSDLQSALQAELNQRANAYRAQINQQLEFQNVESAVRIAHYERLNNELNAFLVGAGSGIGAFSNSANRVRQITNSFSNNRNVNASMGDININTNRLADSAQDIENVVRNIFVQTFQGLQ